MVDVGEQKMTVRYVGYYPMPGVDRADYRDWLRIRESDDIQARLDIEAGNVPAGMIVEWRGALWSVWSDNKLRRYA